LTTAEGDADGLTVAEDIEASPHIGESGKPNRNHRFKKGSYSFIPSLATAPPKSEFLSLYKWKTIYDAVLPIGKTTCSKEVAELQTIVYHHVVAQVGVDKNKSMFRKITR
jgi:hypothetical protein